MPVTKQGKYRTSTHPLAVRSSYHKLSIDPHPSKCKDHKKNTDVRKNAHNKNIVKMPPKII